MAPIRGAPRSQPVHAVPARARRAAWPRAAHLARRSRGTVFPRHPLRHDSPRRVSRGRVPVQQRRHPRKRVLRLGPAHVRRSRRRGALREQHHHPGDDRGRGSRRGGVQRGGADSKEPRGRQLGRIPPVGRGRRRAAETPRRARRRQRQLGRGRGRGRRLRVGRGDDSRSRV